MSSQNQIWIILTFLRPRHGYSPHFLSPFHKNTASFISLSSISHHRLKLKPPKLSSSSQISLDSPQSDSSPPKPKQTGIIVIGAGLAGLAAATRLSSDNIHFLLVEAFDAVGGRVRTDIVDGFLLDRGFQIFITTYPEAQKLLDYEALDLQKFYSGAQLYYAGGFHTVADPLRHFQDSLGTLTNPIGTVVDKLLIALTRIRVLTKSDYEILTTKEVQTVNLLREIGFSESIVDRSHFLEEFSLIESLKRRPGYSISSSNVNNTLPAKGISAIPEQLAAKLPSQSILFNSRVLSVDVESDSSSSVKLQNGDVLRSENGVIIAVEEPEAVKLFAGKMNGNRSR